VNGRLVILACGNPSRGDDALGPLLLERVAALPSASSLAPVLITDFQLQVEHAADLDGVGLALFVDASVAAAPPFRLSRLQPAKEVGYTTHALSPASVLAVFRQVYGRDAPPSFQLAVRGERFELGEALSPAAAANLEQAVELVDKLLADPSPSSWDAYCK
jgi:hydrogenase maturation protease